MKFSLMLNLFSNLIAKRWWETVPEGVRLVFFFVSIFISFFVLAVIFYLAGLIVVGGRKARFTDAFLISLLGTVFSAVFFAFIPYPLIALLLAIFVWLLLIKQLYETGWLGAIAVSILAIVVYLAIAILVALALGIMKEVLELLTTFI